MASTQADASHVGKFYKHQPLGVEEHQIRLLQLCNPSEDTMNYRLLTFDLKNAPSYVALSYTWGEEHPTGCVNIDGKRLEIGINLFNFLRTYKTDDYLWIDQICIDQSNPEERSRQVREMWRVYTRCKFVLVWLRDESTYTPSTRQAALDFNNGVESYLEHGHREYGSDIDKKFLKWPTLVLLHNSYFERLWIVQELFLAENIQILVEGNVWVSWESLRTKQNEIMHEIALILPSTSWMVGEHFHRSSSHNMPLGEIYNAAYAIGIFCEKKCKDPRDKVYGLMGIIYPASRVEIDYTKSVHQVFLDAVMAMIKEFWYMTHVTPDDDNYQFYRKKWRMDTSIVSSLILAQVMNFTALEVAGCDSFIKCIWARVRQYDHISIWTGFDVDAKAPCITSVGFEPQTHQVSSDERLGWTCDRWWYECEGNRYYHDCKEWSGEVQDQEYTVLPCQDPAVLVSAPQVLI